MPWKLPRRDISELWQTIETKGEKAKVMEYHRAICNLTSGEITRRAEKKPDRMTNSYFFKLPSSVTSWVCPTSAAGHGKRRGYAWKFPLRKKEQRGCEPEVGVLSRRCGRRTRETTPSALFSNPLLFINFVLWVGTRHFRSFLLRSEAFVSLLIRKRTAGISAKESAQIPCPASIYFALLKIYE